MHQVDEMTALDEEALGRALEMLQDVIREKGLRRSTARDRVARAALKQQRHFTADELITDLRGKKATVHPASVYRILPLLVEAGLLKESLLSEGDSTTYERAFEREHHDHLICQRCGKIVEFHFEAFEVLQEDLASRFGFVLVDHVHELRGICSDCIGTDEPAATDD